MNSADVHATLERVFRDVFEDEAFAFSDALSRADLTSWDSLGHIRLVAATEDAFNIQFTLEEIDRLTSVGRIAAEILARQ